MNIAALAPAPIRSTTSITLSAGLLNIPLSVYTGTEPTRVARKEFFNGDVSIEVGRSPIRKDTGDVIHQSDVTRMAQASNGTWVTLGDDEIAACTSDRGVAEVVAFVPLDSLDLYLVENLGQVRPKREKGKPNPAAERAFSLLRIAMSTASVAALVKVAMRGPARYAIITPDGDLLYVFTADAIRQPQPLTDFTFSEAEVGMACNLIEAIGIDAPVITDDTAPVVQSYVDAKAGGAPEAVIPVAPAATDNLMAALEASIEAAKASKGKATKAAPKGKAGKGKAA